MLTKDFYLDFNVTGSERKRLVQAISAYTGADSKYLGAPTFSYEVDYFTIDKNGVVSFDDRADSEEIEGLLETLANDPAPRALLTVYETSGSTPVHSGAMMCVDRSLRTVGTIGGGCGESAVLREAVGLIGTGQTRCRTIEMNNDVAEDAGMVCGGRMSVLIEDFS